MAMAGCVVSPMRARHHTYICEQNKQHTCQAKPPTKTYLGCALEHDGQVLVERVLAEVVFLHQGVGRVHAQGRLLDAAYLVLVVGGDDGGGW